MISDCQVKEKLAKQTVTYESFSDSNAMDRYLQNGTEIFNEYCSSTENGPTMLPRAPQQKYIDLYPNEDGRGCKFENDRQQQLNYEAEVKVYRALESLMENIIVLHGFQYTHHQYRLCDKSHQRKGCISCKKCPKRKEGECDFLVIGSNYFVIIEAKNVTFENVKTVREVDLQAFNRSLKKSVSQREKISALINSIGEGNSVLQFTAFPNLRREFLDKVSLGVYEKSLIITEEDLEQFSTWWKNNVTGIIYIMDEPESSNHDKVRDVLLAIWCTDLDDCDKSKCSLGRCIKDIDDKLRGGEFTFRTNNPNVVPAPLIIRDYLGEKNLTKPQLEAFNSEQKCLWIFGPAGSGKSVILLAKLIQVAQSDENSRCILFCFMDRYRTEDNQMQLKLYETALNKAGIHYSIIEDLIEITNIDDRYAAI